MTPEEATTHQLRLLRDMRDDLRALVTQARAESSRSHVELTEDSKGLIHPNVKVYDGSPTDTLLQQALAIMAEAKLVLAQPNWIESWEQALVQARQGRQERDVA